MVQNTFLTIIPKSWICRLPQNNKESWTMLSLSIYTTHQRICERCQWIGNGQIWSNTKVMSQSNIGPRVLDVKLGYPYSEPKTRVLLVSTVLWPVDLIRGFYMLFSTQISNVAQLLFPAQLPHSFHRSFGKSGVIKCFLEFRCIYRKVFCFLFYMITFSALLPQGMPSILRYGV